MIDTLTLAERLEKEAGNSPTQARAFARILADTLDTEAASKSDLSDAERRVRSEVRDAESRLRTEFNQIRGDLHQEIGSLAWKMAGLLSAQGAAIVAIIKRIP